MGDRDQQSREQLARRKAEMQPQVEAAVGEPVLAFGFFGDAAYWESSSTFATRTTGNPELLTRGIKRLFGGKKAVLPTQGFLAVTADRIVLVDAKRRGATVVPTEISHSWDRSTVKAQVGDEPTWTEVSLQGPDEDRPARLRSTDHSGTGVNDDVLALLRG